jgi:hypothetical protein
MSELRKIYRTTLRDVESQVVIDALFIPKALLHDEVRGNAFKALRATSRAFGFLLQDQEPKEYGEGEFSSDDLKSALNITSFLAADLFERNDIIAAEMSDAKMTAIAALVATGVTVGTVAAAGVAGPVVLLYCGAGILVVAVGTLVVGGAVKWLGF